MRSLVPHMQKLDRQPQPQARWTSTLAFVIAALVITALVFLAMGAGNAKAQSKSLSELIGGGQQAEFLPVSQALPFSFSNDEGNLQLNWAIAPGHYLYKDKLSVTPLDEGVAVGNITFNQQSDITHDEYFGEVAVFYDPVEATVPITLPEGMSEARFKVRYQGCAVAGLCYPPQTEEVLYFGQTSSPAALQSGENYSQSTAAKPSSQPSASDANESSAPADALIRPALGSSATAFDLANYLENNALGPVLVLFFLLGLGLTFTPCVLPMIPVISALVANSATQSTRQAFILACSYVLGMALVYAAAGVITGALGASFNLQARLQSPWVLIFFTGLFVLFALAMFGLFELRLPRAFTSSIDGASRRLSGGKLASVFGIGAASALIISPCVSAPLAGSLLYISTTQNAVTGGFALFSMALGMGVPLIAVAVGGRKLLPKSGLWMNAVKQFYGVLMLAVAIWLLERLIYPEVALALWSLLLLTSAVQLGAFEPAVDGWARTRKGVGIALFAYGIALLAGALSGAQDPLRPLAPFSADSLYAGKAKVSEMTDLRSGTSDGYGASDARKSGAHLFEKTQSVSRLDAQLAVAAEARQPVILDFYADWCISCKVMERRVFSDSQVRSALSDYRALQIDVTDNTAAHQSLLDRLGLFGPPAILFFDEQGNEVRSARILGEMSRTEFLNHLQTRIN